MKNGRIHITGIVSGLIIAYLLNFGYAFYLYGLLQKKNISLFSVDETTKLIQGLWWFLATFCVYYVVWIFNYSWKYRLLKTEYSQWLRQVISIGANLIVFFLLAFLAVIFSKPFLSPTGGNPLYFFAYKFIFVELAALLIANYLITNRNTKAKDVEVSQLREEKRQAELQALKEQISPHFLFNTLNTLSAVIRTEGKSESIDFVESLSEVYRYILDSQSTDLVNVAEEFSFLKSYIFLLKKRFGDNLRVEMNDEMMLMKGLIPPLALQILIENAVKHNKLTTSQPLYIKIKQEGYFICVENSVNAKELMKTHGIGLINLNKRFQLITNKSIEIAKSDTIFSVTLPIIQS